MTPEQALELLRSRGVVPFTDVKGGPESFVFAVVGGPVKGSWWGHPRGKEIFNLACSLAAESVSVKLVSGKETLVHRSVFPALARVVTDESWRAPRIASLSKDAKKLLAQVEKTGSVHGAAAKPRLELQRALLVHTDEEHTEKGHHASVLVPWSRWVTPAVAKAAKKLSLEAALEELQPRAV